MTLTVYMAIGIAVSVLTLIRLQREFSLSPPDCVCLHPSVVNARRAQGERHGPLTVTCVLGIKQICNLYVIGCTQHKIGRNSIERGCEGDNLIHLDILFDIIRTCE